MTRFCGLAAPHPQLKDIQYLLPGRYLYFKDFAKRKIGGNPGILGLEKNSEANPPERRSIPW
jgi:hypothetical protein